MQTGFNACIGLAGAVLNYMFGGWSELLDLFLLVIAIDYVTGVAASIKEGAGLNSQTGFWGIWKKALMMLIVMLGHRFDEVLNADMFMAGFVYFFIANELISITENFGRLGVPLPERIRQLIEVLKERERDGK